jgi:hypothetical protein
MKTQKIPVTIALFLITTLSLAQNNNIRRPIGKEVQKISNKIWLNTEYHLTVSSVAYAPISKDVQLISNRLIRKRVPGNMVSTGYPVWTISKGVQRVSGHGKSGRSQRTTHEQRHNESINK